jgi:hypothetical protein
MPTSKSEKEKSGARRLAAKAPKRQAKVSAEASGPRRLHTTPESTSSTSSKESGPRRLYTSSFVQGPNFLGHRAVKAER